MSDYSRFNMKFIKLSLSLNFTGDQATRTIADYEKFRLCIDVEDI